MKTILLSLLILLSAFAAPDLAALTDTDLDKIRLIVKEEIEAEIKPIKADIERLKTEGAMLRTELSNLKENVKTGFENVQKDFDDVEKDFDRQNNIIIACIGLPMLSVRHSGAFQHTGETKRIRHSKSRFKHSQKK